MARENYLDLKTFCKRMKDEGMAAVVAASPNGVFHTSGCLIITHNPIRDRLAFCVTTADGHQCLVVCTIELSLCEHDSWVKDIRGYVEFQELPTHLLAKTLAGLGLAGKTVGIDLSYLRESYFAELVEAAPSIRFEPADALLAEMREVKPASLVAHMTTAAKGVQTAIQETFDETAVGMTERQIRLIFRRNLARHGADASYLIVAVGPNIKLPEHRATTDVLEAGQPLLLDATVTFDGYVAEGAATRIFGAEEAAPAEAAFERVYQAAVKALASGARGEDVFGQAKAAAKRSGGALKGDFVGYGISFGGKEPPLLSAHSRDTLKPGMTLAVDVTYEHGDGMLLRRKRMWLVGDKQATEVG